MSTPLFVYGTLKRRATGKKHQLLRLARPLGPASIVGRLFDLGPYPGVVRESRKGQRVFGELYEIPITESPRVLRRLDLYEGPAYSRQKALVTLGNGRRRFAWVYVLRKRPGKVHQEVVSGRYRRRRGAA